MDKVSFYFDDITNDKITDINGTPVSPATAKDWIYNNALGTHWIEKDENGLPVFCMYSAPQYNNILSLTDTNGNNPYSVEGKYFKDHPIHAPKRL